MLTLVLAAAAAVVRWLPERWGPAVCRLGARWAEWGWPNRRAIAAENLARAWPAGPPITPTDVFVHLARTGWEFARIPRFRAHGFRQVRLADGRSLDDAIAEGRGVVVATGHLGSWELVAAALAVRIEVPIHLLVRSLGPIDPWVHRQRRQAGLQVIEAGSGAARRIHRALAAGHIVVCVIDQHDPRARCVVPLFGRPAATLDLPARLCLTTGSALVWLESWRDDQGAHSVTAVRVAVDGAGSGRVQALTVGLNERLEAAIRARPAQWTWTHRRWKLSTPEGVRADA